MTEVFQAEFELNLTGIIGKKWEIWNIKLKWETNLANKIANW